LEWENGSVIVTCERCETEFQLDDTRVPQGGARVRCSRCKHAFFVMPPAATPEQAVENAASAALADDPTPDVTEDLPEESALADERERAGGDDESESDWEFNADLPADAGDSSPDLGAAPAALTAADSDETDESDPLAEEGSEDGEESLALAGDPEPTPARVAAPVPATRARESEPADVDADLGSPVNWDFFDKPAERPTAVAPAPPTRTSPPTIHISLAPEENRERSAVRETPRVLRVAAASSGWVATAALCAIALVRGLAPAAPAVTAWPSPAPGVALEEVRGRWLDNVPLGRLYVVSGRVHNLSDTVAALPPLALELRDASGRAVGSPVPLRGAIAPVQLRDADAAVLASAGGLLPGGLAPGTSWEFEAVAWPLPARAERFAIRSGS
jgi:predicted Zn finger-like uncharacterized protein